MLNQQQKLTSLEIVAYFWLLIFHNVSEALSIQSYFSLGEVVIFLDAHCEVGYNWLPPLLAPIHADRRTLSVPVIDGIQWDDFSINPVYARNSHSRGLFEWGMLYKEGTVPVKEEKRRSHHSEPYYAPTHAGGLFAINREWFKELGWYDPGKRYCF